ncbi:MAG: ATP-binding protein [Alkalilacustris sp.]
MPSISVPSSFFVSERDSIYADWRTAFWRELLSNSLDAGATRIRLRTRVAGGRLGVDFIDNGCGMSREVVEEVYMRLGASTKAGGDDIGGFGRARILTCFSHDAYRIRTSDIVVAGQGASYEIETTDRAVRGCAISIQMPACEIDRIHRGLERALRQSSLRCAVEMHLAARHPDGQLVRGIAEDLVAPAEDGWSRFRGWSRKGRAIDTLSDANGPWATLHLNEGEKAIRGRAIVRLRGMSMYDEVISPDAQLTVDLEPGRARSVLTASRDSIRSPFREELQKIFARIASERSSGLRGRPADPVTHVALCDHLGGPGRPMRSGPSPDCSEGDPAPHRAAHPSCERKTDERGWQGTPYVTHQEVRRGIGLRAPVIVHVADATSGQRAVSSRFQGDTWVSEGGDGRNAELLHAAWTAACEVAVETLCRIRPSCGDATESWSTGFVFDRKMDACHMSLAGVDHALLLNPVDARGVMRFRTSDPASMRRLAALALHEVCHIRERWHDEAFAGLLTDLISEVRDRDIDQAIRSALSEARAWQKARSMPCQMEGPPPPP